jgi:hypothetical protein
MTPESVASNLEYLANRLRNGCGSESCQVKDPDKSVYISCNCQPKNYARTLMGLAIECETQGYFWEKDKESQP